MRKGLLIDNYDSFTYNLKHLILSVFDGEIVVVRNDYPINQIREDYTFLIISPGPKTPKESGISMLLIDRDIQKKPILGVCLGMQCLNEYFYGKTVFSPFPMHGKSSLLNHYGHSYFSEIPKKFPAARYHSLSVEPGRGIEVIADSAEGIPMALTHRDYQIFGMQYHPESFMTPHGALMIRNFIKSNNL